MILRSQIESFQLLTQRMLLPRNMKFNPAVHSTVASFVINQYKQYKELAPYMSEVMILFDDAFSLPGNFVKN